MPDLVLPRERVYFAILAVISLLIYLLLIISVVGIVYIIIGFGVYLILQGLFIGGIRGNGIRVSERQFPEVYVIVQELAKRMEINPLPPIFILQEGGLLNAFATRFLARNFVVIYSDILELAYEKGEAAVAFVVAHELGHVKRGHLAWRWLILPGTLIPYLGSAYSRVCEYTADRFGAYYCPNGATDGLLVLAAGKKLYKSVNAQEFLAQINTERGFWVWYSEIFSSHPYLPKRIKEVNSLISSGLPSDRQ